MRILVVEDEHRIANSIKRGLEMESMAVDVAYDGLEGYEMACSEEYDCIVLDLMLPEMDGISVCRKLREENIHFPIIMLTAKGDVESRVNGLNSGADDYLPKPFAFEELLARIKAVTRRPVQSLDAKLVVGDLVLDTVTYRVERDGKKIDLSRKEFSLLEFLMRNERKTLSKDQIISHVWDYDADVLPNTVEVYIGYLRSKVDKPFKKDLIKTIRGFGYMIEG